MVPVPVLGVIKFQYFFRFCLMFDTNMIITHSDKTGDVFAEKILVSRILFKLAG